ncbi:MAG: hypothetical protein QNJ53_20225 [Pleurocapsa sp. MO_192.B19]|nr:hypothetical protein [Pleurocapsa sp. MO_192.B19]
MTTIAFSNLASENNLSELNLLEQEQINGGFSLGLDFGSTDVDSGTTFELRNHLDFNFDDHGQLYLEQGAITQTNIFGATPTS